MPIGASSKAERKRSSAAAIRSTLSRSAASAATRSLTSRTIACPSTARPSSGSRDAAHARLDPDVMALAVAQAAGDRDRPAVVGDARAGTRDRAAVVGVDEVARLASDDLLRRVADQLRRGRRDVRDPPVGAEHEDHVGRVVGQQAMALLGGAQLRARRGRARPPARSTSRDTRALALERVQREDPERDRQQHAGDRDAPVVDREHRRDERGDRCEAGPAQRGHAAQGQVHQARSGAARLDVLAPSITPSISAERRCACSRGRSVARGQLSAGSGDGR